MANSNGTHVRLKEMDAALLTTELLDQASRLGFLPTAIRAVSDASYLHLGQTRMARGNLPRVPYIEHPLRNSLRLIRWRVEDEATIIGTIFHDTVEDCAARIADLRPDDEGTHREVAFRWLSEGYGADALFVVRALTNPIIDPSLPQAKKDRVYRDHFLEAVAPYKRPLLSKSSDLCDNAGSLHHHVGIARPDSLVRRATKYRPVLLDARGAILGHDDITGFTEDSVVESLDAAIRVCDGIIDTNGR